MTAAPAFSPRTSRTECPWSSSMTRPRPAWSMSRVTMAWAPMATLSRGRSCRTPAVGRHPSRAVWLPSPSRWCSRTCPTTPAWISTFCWRSSRTGTVTLRPAMPRAIPSTTPTCSMSRLTANWSTASRSTSNSPTTITTCWPMTPTLPRTASNWNTTGTTCSHRSVATTRSTSTTPPGISDSIRASMRFLIRPGP